MKTIPFDYKLYISGAKAVTSDGKMVKSIKNVDGKYLVVEIDPGYTVTCSMDGYIQKSDWHLSLIDDCGRVVEKIENESGTISALTIEVGGSHYKGSKYQPVQLAEDVNMNICCSSILRYVYRHKNKNGIQDLDKALHYCSLFEECGGKWYGDLYGGVSEAMPVSVNGTPDGCFAHFLKENAESLDKNQIMCILAIQNRDMSMLREYIQKEIEDCYPNNLSESK